MTIAINTPNGNIGRKLTLDLLNRGESVRILSRNPHKVQDLLNAGAELVEGSLDKSEAITSLVRGADQLFWLNPPIFHESAVEWSRSAALQAAELAVSAGVRRVVVLSSIGAQHPADTGPIAMLHHVEKAFFGIHPSVASLRAGFFMENFFGSLPTIASEGVIYHAAPSALALAMVSTGDIAERASEVLRCDWSGHRIESARGPADLTYDEAAAAIAEGLGRPVQAVEISPTQYGDALRGAGLPPMMAAAYAEMYQAIRDGLIRWETPRDERSTTSTTLTEFATSFLAPALAAA